jgi:dTDP-4-amino-4,6-dideoxygalactose transaminase/predicted dehydrogenase
MMRRLFLTGLEGLPQQFAMEFGQKWAAFCGTGYSLLLPHGTDALRIGLAAALDHDGLDYGGEVIVPNVSFIASANAAFDRRLSVALVDVDAGTLTVDARRVEEAVIPGKTRAIMAVHLFGQPADMSALQGIARRHSLVLIEDAAQAHGAIHELGRAGSLGDVAGFSFQSSKNLSAGEGGVLTTNDPDIFDRAHRMHNVGRARVGTQRWTHETLGWNCRPSEYVAAVLLHRLRTLEAEQELRHARFMLLRDLLADVPCVEPLGIGPGVVRHAVHMFVLRYRPEHCDGLSIEDFLQTVQAEGLPIHRSYDMTLAQQPVMQRLAEKHPDYVRVLPTPVADQAVQEIIYLPHPLFLGSEADMAEIAAIFRKVQAHYKPTAPRQPQLAPTQHPRPISAKTPAAADVNNKPVRFGIIGIGSQGQQHAAVLSRHPGSSLVAISDAQEQPGRTVAAELGCRWFPAAERLVHSGEVDAILIATPHRQHVELAIAGLRAGLHVVCEKPLAVTVAEADEVVRAAEESQGTFAVVHQRRLDPSYKYAKELLASGQLGPIYRCMMVESAWRTQAYYRSSPWRGTWKGEGGGVLLNQAPHVLDLYAWLCGMPASLTARCDTTLHQIEVEDTASAILAHDDGMHGYIHINTVECPPISRAVISCDRGRLTIENGEVRLTRLRDSIRNRTATDPRLWGDLDGETRCVYASGRPSLGELLHAFYDNFIVALHGKTDLACPAVEARNAVELANAMILSSMRGRVVSLPLDRAEYADLMMELTQVQPQTV